MNCCEKATDLKKELHILTETAKKLKQGYHSLLIENLKKDLIIRQIKTKIEEKKFLRFENKLSKECLEKLNSIGNSQKQDSTFIAIALNGLYDDNTEIVKQKNLTGRSRNGVKSQITPEKKTY